MRAAVIRFPGTNREKDAVVALTRAAGRPPIIVWHKETELPELDLILLPGGFAYGDYLRAGAMAAHSPVMREVKRQAERGVAVVGICNGFQVLTEAGLLPGALLRNAGLKFVCRDVHLRVETSASPFTGAYNAGDVVRVPVAHHDGNYHADEATLARLEDEDRIAFRYVAGPGEPEARANPNGAIRDIAGILSENRRVLGMMPHPENATDPLQGGTDGCRLFDGMARALA